RATLVEEDHTRKLGQMGNKASERPQSPGRVEVAKPLVTYDQIEGSVANDPVGNVKLTNPGVLYRPYRAGVLPGHTPTTACACSAGRTSRPKRWICSMNIACGIAPRLRLTRTVPAPAASASAMIRSRTSSGGP